MKLTESIDTKKCLTLLNMSKNDLKETFWDKDELCGDFNWTTYINNVKRFLKKGAVSGGEIEQTYNYAKNQSERASVRESRVWSSNASEQDCTISCRRILLRH